MSLYTFKVNRGLIGMLRKAVLIALACLAGGIAAAWTLAPRQEQPESEALFAALELRPGMTVADIGAGTGRLAIQVARRVGPNGHVYATEISAESREAIAERARRENLSNLSVVESKADDANLPESALDAVILRHVYHHLSEPAVFVSNLYSSVKPGGRVAVVDYPPTHWRLWQRELHGIPRSVVEEEMTGAGFVFDERIEPWVNTKLDPFRNLAMRYYCVIFRKNSPDGMH